MKPTAASLVALMMSLAGCAGLPRQAPACGSPPAALGAPAVLPAGAPPEQHLLWEIADSPVLYTQALPPGRALQDLRAGARARADVRLAALLTRQIGVYEAAAEPALRGEAVNGRLVLEGRVGSVGPLRCLEALLLMVQAERYPMLRHPSEFGAFILRRQGARGARLRIYFSSSDRSGLKMRGPVTERIEADVGKGWTLLAHLHNHPFLFDRQVGDLSWTTADTKDDIAGAVAPSMTDVQLYRRFREGLGLRGAWITNGFDTLRLAEGDLQTLRARE